ncbi:hypothetical protein PTTG_28557 [Puccinia triticina 1-1 BBBD Race 1]|uniref:Uncharacterized protein n=2 Tax=Puccinia triticina TaxID=208348 RepID=A0A0C4ERC1_PUCT1|nr:uncharacterized protein PtA15_13A238 [Puccinia triticina]OAV89782.1 hypothetical protein PTTG_28557 [Puccinia triticina 1-1 BBBD Race 1]WAQ90839.1 hypothetical protein PtA15_13A238 [Puccinia triticina]
MDDSSTFDDGMYHPNSKSSDKPLWSTKEDPNVTTVVSAASLDPGIMDPPAPMSTSVGTHSGSKSKHAGAAAIPKETFSPSPVTVNSSAAVSSNVTISSVSATPTAETLPIKSMEVEPPPRQHNSGRAVVAALLSVSAVLLLVLVVGYLTSQRYRRWRESRRARYTETKWKISRPFQEGNDPRSSMREVPQIEISHNELVYAPLDPFARSIPRQGRMPFNFGRSDPVEEIDEERGWLWGTQTSSKKKGTDRLVTPGLGIGRYRSKNGRNQYHASPSSHQSYLKPEESDDTKEELLYADETGGDFKYADGQQERSSPRFNSNGVSYLFGKLKDTISERSFGSLASSTGRLRIDSSRGRWNEVGQSVMDDEKDITAQDDEDDEKTLGLQEHFKSNASLRSASPLSAIVLPELPAFTWDDHSGHKVAKTKRTRAPSLEVEIDDAQTSRAFRQPDSYPRNSGVNSVRQLVNRLEENEGKYTHLPSPSSRQPRRKRKEALPSRYDSQPDPYTPTPASSSRARTERIHGLVKTKSKHLYPGGYLGRSPTKKMRRKESPDS